MRSDARAPICIAHDMSPHCASILPDTAAATRRYDACVPPLRPARDVPRRTCSAAHPGYWCQPVPPFGASGPRLVIVGLAPGMHGANASGPAVHRRLRRHPAVRDAARVRLCRTQPVATARGDGLRLVGVPDHQRGEVPAAATTSRTPAEMRELQRAISPPTCGACRAAASSWRWGASRTTRRCGRSGLQGGGVRVRARRAHPLDDGRDARRQLSLQPLQHQHAPPDRARCSRRVRRDRRAPWPRPRAAGVTGSGRHEA